LLNGSRLRYGRRARLLESLWRRRRARLFEPLLLDRPRLLLESLRLIELTRLFHRPRLLLDRPGLLLWRRNWSCLRRRPHLLRLPPTLVCVLHPVLVVSHLRRRTIVTGRL
jgi:hypothetical protein